MEHGDCDEGDRRRAAWPPVVAIVVLAILFALGALLVMGVRQAREAAIASQAQCPLNQLQFALHNYHAAYGCFPPAFLSDADIECFRGLSSIRQADLSQTQITDAGLKPVATFTSLFNVELSGTRITDAGLEHLKGLIALDRLGLGGTKVTDEGVKKFQPALPKCKIDRQPPAPRPRTSDRSTRPEPPSPSAPTEPRVS